MKKIKLALMLTIGFLSFQTFGQTTDSLVTKELQLIKQKILTLETNTEILQSNLVKCHKQWRDGLGIVVFGIGTTAIGGVIINFDGVYKKNDVPMGYIVTGIGGLASLIGSVVMMDSHKYIGRAGLNFNSKGLIYRFK